MERNCAACAMEWSIELEKALRAKIPSEYNKKFMYISFL